MTEEERAAAFREQATARLQATRARAALLQGSAAARTQLAAAWQPVLDWLRERQAPSFPTPDELQQERVAAYHDRIASLPGLATPDLARDLPIKDPDV